MILHAKLSPSSSSRWLTCTSSVEACEKYENTTNSAAQWGTFTHFIGEQLLLNKLIRVGDKLTEQGQDFIVDDEMLEVATDYANYCKELINKDSVVLIEEKFDLSSIAPEQFGTSDCTILNDKHLHIIDLKTGRNIVDAKDNTQLMLYAIGAVDELNDIYDIEEITLHIVQTRANHIDTYTLSYEGLMEFKEFAAKQARLILEGNTTFNPTEKACKWCSHQAECEALAEFSLNILTGGFDNLEDIDGKVDDIPTQHIKNVLDNAELIESFIKAVKDKALELMQNGTELEGYKLVKARTNRKWRDEAEVEAYLKDKLPEEKLYNKKLVAMGTILKLRKDDEKLKEFIIKPEGKPVVAKLEDKREPIGTIANEFANC